MSRTVGTLVPKCCACGGDGTRFPAPWRHRPKGERVTRQRIMRGLLELAPGKWICALCTHVAVGGWAKRARDRQLASG